MEKITSKEQCRTCGKWENEEEMFQTDYQTYTEDGDLDEMVCEGCYDTCYSRCSECGEIRHEADLIEEEGVYVCNTAHIEHG